MPLPTFGIKTATPAPQQPVVRLASMPTSEDLRASTYGVLHAVEALSRKDGAALEPLADQVRDAERKLLVVRRELEALVKEPAK
jgi:hypothetical protein